MVPGALSGPARFERSRDPAPLWSWCGPAWGHHGVHACVPRPARRSFLAFLAFLEFLACVAWITGVTWITRVAGVAWITGLAGVARPGRPS